MPIHHPCLNDAGQAVVIGQPSLATRLACWQSPAELASVLPGGALPASLNGIAFAPLAAVPDSPPAQVAEPEFRLPAGLAAAAGVVVVEDDGRVWLVSPTNGFGGYAATFPKGRVDAGASLAATAVREAFEESGLLVRIEAHLLDVRRTLTYTRYYLARRIGGSPAAMGWESQAVHLVPRALLPTVAAHRNDAAVIAALQRFLHG